MSTLMHVVGATQGRRPFSCLIRNVRIVNVFNDTVSEGCIGLEGDRIAYVGPLEPPYEAAEILDGGGCYALPGFVDSHMHLESSMLTPAHFARAALCCGTTTVAADPHEIGNVLGLRGVQALMDAARGLPLRVLMMAPSTIPSAPGFEDSGYSVGAAEAAELLEIFQWSGADLECRDKLGRIREELADVLSYCVLMADVCGLDLDEILNAKVDQNAAKYPVEKARGSAAKYTELT